jgi:hypothetical protein
MTAFIKESDTVARLGKTVYIRKEFHDRIMKIIQVIGENEVSMFSYIDNVPAHHFDPFRKIFRRLTGKKSAGMYFKQFNSI